MKYSLLSGLLGCIASLLAKEGYTIGCILVNIAMWYCYKLALQEYSSIRTQSINMTIQICCSCFFGVVLYKETLEWTSLLKIVLLSSGVYILE